MDKSQRHRRLWQLSVSHLQAAKHDCWKEINELPTEQAKRFRYNSKRGIWTEDEIQIKIEKQVSTSCLSQLFSRNEAKCDVVANWRNRRSR